MKCPYCTKEMRAGYMQCRDGVVWTPRKQLIAALSVLGRDSVSLANGAGDDSRTVYAYLCSDCRKVIIDYSTDAAE